MKTLYTSPIVEVLDMELETGVLGFSQGSEIITPMHYYEYEEDL